MSTIDQCPSTKGKIEIDDTRPEMGPDALHESAGGTVTSRRGQRYWRSAEDFADDPSYRAFVNREFPAGASELAFEDGENGEAGAGESRRGFLKLMGASLALAGAATIPGCRRPEHLIVPYTDEPEHVVPGKPLYFATSMPLAGGGAEGLLVETHQGRPTKIEGNPLHPTNRGKSSVWSQASILETYDPDRLKFPTYNNPARGRLDATWDDFKSWWSSEGKQAAAANGGAGLAVICDKKTSPTLDGLRERLLNEYPNATWVWWDPADSRRSSLEGTEIAFGSPRRVLHDFDGAEAVLSLDADFLTEGPNHINESRSFAATRRVEKSGDAMSRLYVCEAHPSGTGSMADHRWRMAPSQTTAFAARVASLVLNGSSAAGVVGSIPASALSEADEARAQAVAADLKRAGRHAVVVAGNTQPAQVHALAAAMNSALGAKVKYLATSATEASHPLLSLAGLTDKMDAGSISTVVTINANPVHDAPGGLGFAEAFAGVAANGGATIALSTMPTETTQASTWELNAATFLESWGDTESYDGTVSAIQPMIAPLYEPAMSENEFVAYLAGVESPDGHTLLSEAWTAALGASGFDKKFRRALHDGFVSGNSDWRDENARLNVRGVSDAVRGLTLGSAPTAESLEVVFETGRIGDGRYWNNGWLQELPQKGTSVVWENPVVLSPATAEELRLLPKGGMAGMYTRAQIPQARLATLTINGVEQEVAVWVCPGVADGVAHVQLGYGRTTGNVGNGVGFNAYPLRTPAAMSTASGATLERSGGSRDLASTQNHWSLEGRTTIVRAIDKKWFDEHADSPRVDEKDLIYKTERRTDALNLAEQMGEMSHTPDNVGAYKNPFNESAVDPKAGARYAQGPQWGMTIDLSSCTGCNLCTVACQSENNIPIVGRTEVAKGREMQWIRVDRYFSGDDLNEPEEMIGQPVACVHCENAPCETVCPVTATVHGPEGTNNMAYNRCIGTRYCANNCPYKVRRFNFFDYAVTKYNGAFLGSEAVFGDEGIDQKKFNKNLIPPRLREKLDEISKMKNNPDVTVRSRGVMEKCTYCIQRVNAARQESKVKGHWTESAPIPDGFFQVACQQACPSDSIVFGDILDESSEVHASRMSERSYMLLGYLNTRPRTSHMLRVRNPNEPLLKMELAWRGMSESEIEEYLKDPLAHHGGGHGDHGHDAGHDENGHGDGEGGDSHGEHSFVDPAKRFMDEGYRASLRVLS